MPSGKEPARVWSFGKGEISAAGIETIEGRRGGGYIDGAGTIFVNVIGDVELRRQVRPVGGAASRQDDAMAGGISAIAPIVEGITAAETVRIFKCIDREGVTASGGPA